MTSMLRKANSLSITCRKITYFFVANVFNMCFKSRNIVIFLSAKINTAKLIEKKKIISKNVGENFKKLFNYLTILTLKAGKSANFTDKSFQTNILKSTK